MDSWASTVLLPNAAAAASGFKGSGPSLAGAPVALLLSRVSAAASPGCESVPGAAAMSAGAVAATLAPCSPVLARLADGIITVDGVDALSAISCHVSRAACVRLRRRECRLQQLEQTGDQCKQPACNMTLTALLASCTTSSFACVGFAWLISQAWCLD